MHGPMDYAKTLELRLHPGHLDESERRDVLVVRWRTEKEH